MIRKTTPPPCPPLRQQKPAPLTKREFMQQYVLARAATMPDTLSGVGAAEAAELAWNTIEKACAE